MKGKIEAILLKSFAGVFKKFDVTDIAVEIKKEGWYAAATSPDNTRLCEVLLRRDAWVEYNFSEKVFAVDIDKLYHYTQDFRKGEIIEISFEDTAKMMASFSLNGSLVRTFTLLAEEVRAKPKIPELEYKVEITLLAPQIEVIKNVLATKLEAEWGNEIGIGVVERVIRLIEDGYEVEKVTAPPEYDLCLYVADDEGIKNKTCVSMERGTNYPVIEPCASVYSFDYFKSVFALVTKAVATGTVTIQFAFEYPLKLSYEHKGLEVMILVAPRIDEEKKLKERDVLEELRTPIKPKEEVEVEIESTATTLYFLPTAKRLLKPFKRTEYSDVELIDILLGQPLPELEGILGSLKLEAIWKQTSFGGYSVVVKEEELSREPADIDAIIKIVENYDLMKYPYLEIREYYKHPEQLEKGKIELEHRVDALTRSFFGGFGAKIVTIEGFLTFIRDSKGTEGDREGIRKSFAWVKKKYEQIPFSELSESPYYDDYKPLFAINEILPELAKNIELALSEGGKYCDTAIGQLNKIHELGREYTKTTEKYYKELTGQSLREADVETRALMEYRSKEQIQDQISWLKEQGIEPNSFEKAAMAYYGVEITEEEPPWRRLMDVIKELEKEHGLEVPEDIAVVAATEVGIVNPEDLIGELKRDGILYSPAKGLIARVEIEKPPEEKLPPEEAEEPPEVKEPWMMTKDETREWDFPVPEGGASMTPKTVFSWEKEDYETLYDLSKQKDQFRFNEVLGKGWESKWKPMLHLKAGIVKNQPITIYRATEYDYIIPGSYVSESLEYAEGHLETILRGKGKILSTEVKPSELMIYGDPHEFIYIPESVEAFHKPFIQKALREGKPVPEEVLVDYQGLALKYGIELPSKLQRFSSSQRPTPKEKIAEIARLYKEGKSIPEIRKYLNVSQRTVYRTLNKYNIPVRERGYFKGNISSNIREEIVRLYVDEKLSTYDIGEMLGVSPVSSFNILKEKGISLRNKSEAGAIAVQSKGTGSTKRGLSAPWYSVKNKAWAKADSRYELVRMHQLDNDPNVIMWTKQTEKISYGKNRFYVPDFYIEYKDGRKVVEEVKPFYKIKDANVLEKEKAAKEHLKDKNIDYKLVTENEIGIEYLRNFDYNQIPLLTKEEKQKFKRASSKSDYPMKVKKPPEEEIPEEKWENITKEKLEEIRRTSKISEKYAISQAKAAKKVSGTEETVYAKLPDELDLGPYSEVLLYTPVEEIRYLSKAERAAFIKLVDRGWFQVYRVSKPVSDKYPSGFTYVLKKTREEEKPPEKEILFYKYVKKELDEGAVVYTSYPTPVSEILIAQLPDGRWNVHPDPPLFPEKPFKKRTEALEYAETNMKTSIEEEGEKPEKIPEVPPPYELIKKERLSPEELEQLKKDIADLKRTREAWEKQLPGYEARQAIPELDRDIAEYEAKVKEEEKEEAKAEIKKRIKPIKHLISEAEGAITECDKGFETCLEFCDDDLEECYDRCHEEYEDTKDIEKCRKECEKERDKCHDKCEAGATECYDDSAKEVIGEDIEEGDITKAEEDLETFMDYISDELYKKLAEKLPKKVVEEEKIKVRVLEDIPTFMGTDGEIYKLNKEDIVELPKTNADVLCERGVAEPFVEKPPEEPVPEKVKIHGVLKTRYRCPICYRAAPDNFCMVHSDVEAIDLLAADEPIKEAVIDLTFLDLFKTKYPEKKRWTIEELHDAMGIDIDYAPEFLAKPRIPETYAQYYARELGVEIEEIKPPEAVKPPVEERTETQEMVFEYFKKEIAETGVDAYQRGYLDAVHREIGREFTVDHLLLADSEELYRLMDLKREKMEAELRAVPVPVPPKVLELAEKDRMEILRKIRKYKKVEVEVPELKMGAKVKMNDKEGVLVDVSANKYRVNWDDGTWDWIMKKDSESVIVY